MLRPVNSSDTEFLYQLLQEREHPISHVSMPDLDEHRRFVDKHPYRYWYIIGDQMGSIYLGMDNSIGVVIRKSEQRKGWAKQAIEEAMKLHKPLPGIPSVRAGSYIANISPVNEASARLFESLGFGLVQYTYRRKHG